MSVIGNENNTNKMKTVVLDIGNFNDLLFLVFSVAADSNRSKTLIITDFLYHRSNDETLHYAKYRHYFLFILNKSCMQGLVHKEHKKKHASEKNILGARF